MLRDPRIALFGLGVLICYGSVAHAQHMNSPNAPCRKVVVTSDLAQCFTNAFKTADRGLNLMYQQIQQVLEPEDQQKLRTAQRFWLQFRDDTCVAERSLYETGTGAYPAHQACMEELTRQRTADLKVIYGWVMEKFPPQ